MDASTTDDERLRPDRLRRLASLMLGGYALAVLVVAAAAAVALHFSAGARSYLSAESLWAKAQRDAVYHLDEYAADGEEHEWRDYLSALRVPLGDRQARVELQKPDPDYELVREGLRRGGLEPEDIDGMIRVHRWLGWMDPVERAFSAWARGDSLMRELHAEAGILRREWEPPPPDSAVVRATMKRVRVLNTRLTHAELEFAAAMDRASRTVERWALWAVGGVTVLLLVGGLGVSWWGYRVLRDREEAIRRAERRYRRIFERSQDAVYVTDRDGTIVEMSPAGVELFGYPPEQLREMSAEQLYHDPEDRERFRRRIEEEGEVEGFEVELETRDGSVRDCELTSTARTEDGEIVGYQGIIRDVTEQRRAEEKLQHQALHDSLTDLPNRALLWDRLEQAAARRSRSGGPLAVLFVDLDRFKVINDEISHAAGDRALVKVAHRLYGCVREPDTVARVGGDEFVVLAEDMEELEEAEIVARRVGEALEAPLQIAGRQIHLDASIGIAGLGADETTEADPSEVADELLRRADQAMYRAKESRGTTWRRHEAGTYGQRSRIRRENELRRAVDRGEFVVHYQPIVELDTRTTRAVEPLVRWRHPDRGLLRPGSFLELAGETGLIRDIDEWVVETAAREVARWNRELRPERPLTLQPNLSAAQFENPELGPRLEEILDEAGLAPGRVRAEVTEHAVMRAPGRARQLADLGVGVCIDDFGTGYSSLRAVRELAADALKVDMSFVHGIGDNVADEAIVRTVLTLGRSLGLQVVAEGVETRTQLRWLRDAGFRRAQGHLFARPVPAGEMTDALRADGGRGPGGDGDSADETPGGGRPDSGSKAGGRPDEGSPGGERTGSEGPGGNAR